MGWDNDKTACASLNENKYPKYIKDKYINSTISHRPPQSVYNVIIVTPSRRISNTSNKIYRRMPPPILLVLTLPLFTIAGQILAGITFYP